MTAAEKDRMARQIAEQETRDYDRWLAAHPDATTLEQLAEIYRRGNAILRRERVR